MTLLRIARQAELGEGQKIVKEVHGKKLLLARVRGNVYCTDAHCFHMGAALIGGDIEESGGHPCIVCPAHRYRIDMCSGKKIDSRLDGSICASADKKQRTYDVHPDADHIWVNLPDGPQSALPSDVYNQAGAGLRSNYGLFGSVAGMTRPSLAPPTPLQPYAGERPRPLVHSPTEGQVLELSQESTDGTAGPPAHAAAVTPQRLFAGRVDAPHVARRKAAVAAIRAKAYKPPTAAAAQALPRAVQAPPRAVQGQRTLFEAWGVQAVPATVVGPEDMEF